jgi:hypothetical protein
MSERSAQGEREPEGCLALRRPRATFAGYFLRPVR